MSRIGDLGGRLYRGDVSIDFVGRRRLWFAISALVLVIGGLGLGFRGLDFGVEFTGGSVFTFQSPRASVAEVQQTTESAVDVNQVVVQEVSGDRWRVQTDSLNPQQINTLRSALADDYGISRDAISQQVIGPTWGQQVSQQAGIGIAVFLGLVVLYLSMVFEWRMAVAAVVALLHDIALTTGVYALVGFEVTPATAIGLLTILGFSLYDTVVVFDKVRENTANLLGGARMTLSQAANLAVNQVLLRSINTSVVAVLPIAAILFVGAGLLGAGILKDIALVLFVGTAVGIYSSIFIATPVFTQIKERDPQMQALARRVAARQSGAKTAGAAEGTRKGAQGGAAAGTQDGGADTGGDGDAEEPPVPASTGAAVGQVTRVVQEGERQQPRRTGSKKRPSGKKRR